MPDEVYIECTHCDHRFCVSMLDWFNRVFFDCPLCRRKTQGKR